MSDFKTGDLKDAFDAFSNLNSKRVMNGNSGRDVPGSFIEFIARYSDRDLEDMILHLERNKRSLTPDQRVEAHISIVRYMQNAPDVYGGSSDLQIDELTRLSALYKRRELQKSLEGELKNITDSVQSLTEIRARMETFMQILYEHLHTDRSGRVDPREVRKCLDDSSLKLVAYGRFAKEVGIELENPERYTENGASSSLVTLRTEQGLTPETLFRFPLDQRVVAYYVAGFFTEFFARRISGENENYELRKKEHAKVALTSREDNQISVFESGEHLRYSPAAYLAIYNRGVWSRFEGMLSRMMKQGAKVSFNFEIK